MKYNFSVKTIIFLLFVISTVQALSAEPFSISLYDDISNQADIFPENRLNFLTKFKRDSVLFDIDQKSIAEEVKIDSTYQYVIIYQRLFDNDFRSSKVMKYSDFMDQKIKYEDRKIWLVSVTKNLGISLSSNMFEGDEIALDIPFKIKSKTFHRVFGGNNIGLRVKGSLSISLIGQKSYTDLPNVEDSSFDFTLDQTQNISIRGKVGTKVDVDIAQNTESLDFENSLKITYTGESDEIIQKMEAGNIGLSLPGTRYVSFSGVNKGLFGLKTETKIGKFKSTSIASFEKGQKNQIEIKGGVRKQEKLKNAKDYLRYKYFFVDSTFKENMATPQNYEKILEHQGLIAAPYKIENYTFELYVTRTETGTQALADIYIDHTRPSADVINGYSNLYLSNRRVKLINAEDYYINYELGYIRLKSFYLGEGEVLAAKFVKKNQFPPYNSVQIGKRDSTGTKLELQILGEKGQKWDMPWNRLEWKNIYSLDGVDISKDEFKLTIQKNTPSGLKTEEYDSANTPKPYLYWYEVSKKEVNDEVDIGFLNSANGEFIFPNQMPFDPDMNSIIRMEGSRDSLFTDREIYTDDSYMSSEFSLKFEFSSKSSTYELGFNVIEGSEVVRSGATTLVKDVDYIINYNSGQLSIINDRYLTADIEILYESASIFQLDQKMLLGNRVEYNINKDSYIGATVLYLSEETNEEKVHVGYEPKRNMVLDINGQTSFDLPYLTKAVDWLPLIETDTKSKLSFEGEIAQIIPNPNPLDAAYIDDFESSKIKKSLGITYGAWSDASYPDEYNSSGFYSLINGAETTGVPSQYFLKSYSGKSELSFYWYNPKDEDKLTKEDIYANVPGDERNDKVSTLNLVFKPTTRNEAVQGSIDPKDSWSGIMKYLYSSYQDFREVKYIEFLVSTNKNITLNLDIGDLSEDIIPNGGPYPDSEDKNANGVLDIGDNSEDTGYDMKKGTADFYDLNADSLKQPYEFYSFDNHPVESADNPTPDSQINNYWDFIKTEGNGKLDTEDLDGGGNLDTSIRAYRYTIDLKSNPSTNDNFVVSTDYSSGSNFALYRIPIEKFTSYLNKEPDISKMKYIKIWVNNSQDTVFSTKINFVTLDLVGNEWAAKGPSKGKIEAKTINNEDDKERYYSPPGVKKLDDNGFEEPEQSLSLNVTLSPFLSQYEFENGRYAFLTKEIFKGENYLQYEELKMFIHGGTRAQDPYWDENRKLYFIYRFGTDSVNYYEYRSKLVNGWKNDEVNNQMIIRLEDLTNLKTLRSDLNMPADSIFLKEFNNENINRYIGIRGNPTLQSVKYFNAGILDSAVTELNTEIWIDELRLVKVMKEPGMAMRAKGRIEIADLATVDAEITKQDEEFHRIEDNKGNGINSINTSLNTSMNLDKFLPKKYGLSFPVRYSYSNSSQYTKYQGATDILVDENNIPDSVRTESTRNSYDFSIRKTSKSNNPFIKYSVDNLSLSGNASFSEGSNASYKKQESESYNYNMSYNLGLPESWFSFSPFFWGKDVSFFKNISDSKISFFPSSYNFSIQTGQSENRSLSRRNNNTVSRSFQLSRNFSTSLNPIPILNSSYTLSLKSDMYKDLVKKDSTGADTVVTNYNRDLGDLFYLEFGELSNYESSLNNTLKLNISKYMINDFNLKTSYSWVGNLNSRTVSNSVKNRYDSKFNSRIKTKEIITEIQKGVNYLLPEKKVQQDNPASVDASSDKFKANPNSADSAKAGTENKPPDGASRLSRTTTSKSSGKSVLGFLKDNLSDLSLSYSQGRENSFTDIPSLDQANTAFIFGFANRPDETGAPNSSGWSGSWALNGSTKLALTKNLSLDGISYQFSRSYRNNNNEGFAGNDSETKFIWPWVTDEEHKKAGADPYLIPNYSIGISGLQELLQAKDQITSLTISHSKSGSEALQWNVDGPTPGLYLTGIPDLSSSDLKIRSASYTSGFSPLAGIKIGLKNGFNFGANYNYSFDMKETYIYTDDVKSIQSGEKKYTRELRITAGYNQKGGFSVPFNFWPFKGAKLDNDISYNLAVSFSSNDRHNYDIKLKEYDSLEKGIKSTNFTINPDITYRVSKKLNGTASYSYNYNETQNYDARSVVNTNHKFELRAVLSITGN